MNKPLAIESLHHISRRTHHLEESRAFYRDVLGFRPIPRPPFPFEGAWLYNYGIQIHLIAAGDDSAPDDAEVRTRTDHVAFHVPDTAVVQQLLEKRGITYRIQHVPQTDVTQLFFQDPAGTHIEIGTYPPVLAPHAEATA